MIIDEYLFMPPDWKEPLLYRRKWMTGIMPSINNMEQRSMHYTWPRRSLSFNVITKDYHETAYLKQRLYKSLHKVWGTPFWQDETYLSSVAPIGQKVLGLDTRWRNFDLNGYCVLYQSNISWEVGQIDILSDSQITLKNNLGATWSKGTSVFPILAGRIRNDQTYDMITSSMIGLSLEVTEEFDYAVTRRIGTGNGYPPFKGYSLFDRRPNWGEKIEFKFIHPYSYLSFLGKSYSFSHYDETEFGLKNTHLCKSKDEIQEYLDFFDYCMGRWREFWYPSHQQDIKITQPFSDLDTYLIIDPIQFQTYWLYKKAGGNLKIDWPGEDYVCVGILDFIPPDTLVLESPVGKSASQDQLPYITASFIYFGRFAQDEIQVEYMTNEIGKIDLSFQTNFKETPEIVS